MGDIHAEALVPAGLALMVLADLLQAYWTLLAPPPGQGPGGFGRWPTLYPKGGYGAPPKLSAKAV